MLGKHKLLYNISQTRDRATDNRQFIQMTKYQEPRTEISVCTLRVQLPVQKYWREESGRDRAGAGR